MKIPATGIILAAILAPVTAAGQSYTEASLGVNLFDGAALGLGFRHASGPVFLGARPAGPWGGIRFGSSFGDPWCRHPRAYGFGCRRPGFGVGVSLGFSFGFHHHALRDPWLWDPWFFDPWLWDPWDPGYLAFGFGLSRWGHHGRWHYDSIWYGGPWWYPSPWWYTPGWYAPAAFAWWGQAPAPRVRPIRRVLATSGPAASGGAVFKESPRRSLDGSLGRRAGDARPFPVTRSKAATVRASDRLRPALARRREAPVVEVRARPAARGPVGPSRPVPRVRGSSDGGAPADLSRPSDRLRAIRLRGPVEAGSAPTRPSRIPESSVQSRSPGVRLSPARPSAAATRLPIRAPARGTPFVRPAGPTARALGPPTASDVRRAPRQGSRPSVRSAPAARSSPRPAPTRRGRPPPLKRRRGGG